MNEALKRTVWFVTSIVKAVAGTRTQYPILIKHPASMVLGGIRREIVRHLTLQDPIPASAEHHDRYEDGKNQHDDGKNIDVIRQPGLLRGRF